MCPQFNGWARGQSRLDRIVMIVITFTFVALGAHRRIFLFFFAIYKCLEWNCCTYNSYSNNDDGVVVRSNFAMTPIEKAVFCWVLLLLGLDLDTFGTKDIFRTKYVYIYVMCSLLARYVAV